MRARDLRPCDGCGGQLAGRMPDGTTRIQFYVVRMSIALLNPTAVNQHIGLTAFFQGNVALAEAFAPNPEVADLLGDQPDCAWDEALLCFGCWTEPRLSLASLAALVSERTAKAAGERVREVEQA